MLLLLYETKNFIFKNIQKVMYYFLKTYVYE